MSAPFCATLVYLLSGRMGKLMPKRLLRVIQWIGLVPAECVCTVCNRNFKVQLHSLSRVSDAQKALQLKFDQHKCANDGGKPPIESSGR